MIDHFMIHQYVEKNKEREKANKEEKGKKGERERKGKSKGTCGKAGREREVKTRHKLYDQIRLSWGCSLESQY